MFFRMCGKGKPLVFLHGWGCDGSIFGGVATCLNEFCCYLPDFNGFGKSVSPPTSGWSVLQYANALRIFFLEHNISHAMLVAHSFGCRVAMVFAAKYPDLVEKMILCAPAGLRRFSIKRSAKVAAYKLRKLFSLNSGKVASKFGSADYNAARLPMRNTLVKVVNADLSSYARKIKCPVLVVNGNDDTETPLWHAKKLCKLIAGAQMVCVDGGHFAVFQNPKALAQIIWLFSEEAQ